MEFTHDTLHKRICDVEGGNNPQTFLEFIRQSEDEFGMEQINLEALSNKQLESYMEFLDYLWDK